MSHHIIRLITIFASLLTGVVSIHPMGRKAVNTAVRSGQAIARQTGRETSAIRQGLNSIKTSAEKVAYDVDRWGYHQGRRIKSFFGLDKQDTGTQLNGNYLADAWKGIEDSEESGQVIEQPKPSAEKASAVHAKPITIHSAIYDPLADFGADDDAPLRVDEVEHKQHDAEQKQEAERKEIANIVEQPVEVPAVETIPAAPSEVTADVVTVHSNISNTEVVTSEVARATEVAQFGNDPLVITISSDAQPLMFKTDGLMSYERSILKSIGDIVADLYKQLHAIIDETVAASRITVIDEATQSNSGLITSGKKPSKSSSTSLVTKQSRDNAKKIERIFKRSLNDVESIGRQVPKNILLSDQAVGILERLSQLFVRATEVPVARGFVMQQHMNLIEDAFGSGKFLKAAKHKGAKLTAPTKSKRKVKAPSEPKAPKATIDNIGRAQPSRSQQPNSLVVRTENPSLVPVQPKNTALTVRTQGPHSVARINELGQHTQLVPRGNRAVTVRQAQQPNAVMPFVEPPSAVDVVHPQENRVTEVAREECRELQPRTREHYDQPQRIEMRTKKIEVRRSMDNRPLRNVPMPRPAETRELIVRGEGRVGEVAPLVKHNAIVNRPLRNVPMQRPAETRELIVREGQVGEVVPLVKHNALAHRPPRNVQRPAETTEAIVREGLVAEIAPDVIQPAEIVRENERPVGYSWRERDVREHDQPRGDLVPRDPQLPAERPQRTVEPYRPAQVPAEIRPVEHRVAPRPERAFVEPRIEARGVRVQRAAAELAPRVHDVRVVRPEPRVEAQRPRVEPRPVVVPEVLRRQGFMGTRAPHIVTGDPRGGNWSQRPQGPQGPHIPNNNNNVRPVVTPPHHEPPHAAQPPTHVPPNIEHTQRFISPVPRVAGLEPDEAVRRIMDPRARAAYDAVLDLLQRMRCDKVLADNTFSRQALGASLTAQAHFPGTLDAQATNILTTFRDTYVVEFNKCANAGQRTEGTNKMTGIYKQTRDYMVGLVAAARITPASTPPVPVERLTTLN